MLFHVTVDHSPETCPIVTNSPEKIITAEGAAKAGVKLVLALGARAQHCTIYNDGRTVEHFTPHAYGTRQNPMDTENVNKKARDLLDPVLGSTRTEEIIRRMNELEKVADVNELMPSLALTPEEMASVRYGH